jgi:hypothetical protein
MSVAIPISKPRNGKTSGEKTGEVFPFRGLLIGISGRWPPGPTGPGDAHRGYFRPVVFFVSFVVDSSCSSW